MKALRSPSYVVSVLVGVAMAFVIAGPTSLLIDAGIEAYDDTHPVATVEAVKLPSPAGEIQLRMKTTKHRNCELQRVVAYDKAADGSQIRTRIERMDSSEAETIPKGETVQSIVWRVWPVTGASVAVWAEHACGERLVKTKLFEMQK